MSKIHKSVTSVQSLKSATSVQIQNRPLVSKIQIGHERPKSKIGYNTKAIRDDSGSYISPATSSSLFDVEAIK